MSSTQSLEWTGILLITGSSISSFLAGIFASVSLLTVSAFINDKPQPNAILLSIWRGIEKRGIGYCRPLILVAAVAHCTNAYLFKSQGLPNSHYLIAAAAFTLLAVPFTIVVMGPANRELTRLRERGTTGEGGKTVETFHTWSRLNVLRSLFPLAGAVTALLAF